MLLLSFFNCCGINFMQSTSVTFTILFASSHSSFGFSDRLKMNANDDAEKPAESDDGE